MICVAICDPAIVLTMYDPLDRDVTSKDETSTDEERITEPSIPYIFTIEGIVKFIISVVGLGYIEILLSDIEVSMPARITGLKTNGSQDSETPDA